MTRHQFKHLSIQIVRRCVQAAAILLVLILIFLGLYHHYRASRTLDDIRSIRGWRGQALMYIDDRMDEVDDPEALLGDYNGNLWSMRVGGIEISDPLAFAESAAATKSIHTPLLVAIVIPVVLTLLLGRVFCSWICPGYVVFEIAGKLRHALRIAGVPPAETRFSPGNKYLLLGVGVLVTAATSAPIFSMLYPPALLSRTAHAVIFGTGVAGMLTILCGLIVFEVFVSPRWWCRTMCPGGALYGLIGSARVLRVEIVPELCTSCGLCQPVCESGLDPVEESAGIECDNCGVCIRHCPEKALGFTVRPPGRPARVSAPS